MATQFKPVLISRNMGYDPSQKKFTITELDVNTPDALMGSMWVGPQPRGDINYIDGGKDFLKIAESNAKGQMGLFESIVSWDKGNIPFIGDYTSARDIYSAISTKNRLDDREYVSDKELVQYNTFLQGMARMDNATMGGEVGELIKGSMKFFTEIGAIVVGGRFIPGPVDDAAAISAKIGGKATKDVAEAAAKGLIFKATAKKGSMYYASQKAKQAAAAGAATWIKSSLAKVGVAASEQQAMFAAKAAVGITYAGAKGALLTAANPTMADKTIALRRLQNEFAGGDESVSASIGLGIIDAWTENTSEMSGPLLGRAATAAMSGLGAKAAAEFTNKIIGGGIFRLFNRKYGVNSVETFFDMAEKVGANGLMEELAEERMGGFMRGLFGVEGDAGVMNALEQMIPSWRQAGVEIMGFAAPGIVGNAIARRQAIGNYMDSVSTQFEFSKKNTVQSTAIDMDEADDALKFDYLLDLSEGKVRDIGYAGGIEVTRQEGTPIITAAMEKPFEDEGVATAIAERVGGEVLQRNGGWVVAPGAGAAGEMSVVKSKKGAYALNLNGRLMRLNPALSDHKILIDAAFGEFEQREDPTISLADLNAMQTGKKFAEKPGSEISKEAWVEGQEKVPNTVESFSEKYGPNIKTHQQLETELEASQAKAVPSQENNLYNLARNAVFANLSVQKSLEIMYGQENVSNVRAQLDGARLMGRLKDAIPGATRIQQEDMMMAIQIAADMDSIENGKKIELVAKYLPYIRNEQTRKQVGMAMDILNGNKLTPLMHDAMALSAELGRYAQKRVGINFREDYGFMRDWDFGKVPAEGRAFTASIGQQMERRFESVLEGFADIDKDGNQKQALVLTTSGFIDAYVKEAQRINALVANQDFLDLLVSTGRLSVNRTKNIEGKRVQLVEINNPAVKKVVRVSDVGLKRKQSESAEEYKERIAESARQRGQDLFIGDEGTLYQRSALFADVADAERLNTAFDQGFQSTAFVRALEVQDLLKSLLLTTSLFHHQAYVRSYFFGSQLSLKEIGKETLRMVEGAGKYIARGDEMNLPMRALNPFGQLVAGIKNMEGYKQGESYIQSFDPMVKDLLYTGTTLSMRQDWNQRSVTKVLGGLRTKLEKVIPEKALQQTIDRVIDFQARQAQILFEEIGPALKLQTEIIEYATLIKKNKAALNDGTVNRLDLAREVSMFGNADFGGMHRGMLGISKKSWQLRKAAFLAPDWTESNVRTMVGAITRKNPTTGSLELATGWEGDLYRDFWRRAIYKAMGATFLFNVVMSLIPDGDDEEGLDLFARYKSAWDAGNMRWLDVDVTPVYRLFGGDTETRKWLSVIGHFRDPIKFIVHPVRSAKHKGAILPRMFVDALTGTDWAGRKFTTTDEFFGRDFEKGYYKTTRRGKYKKGDPKYGKLEGRFVSDRRTGGSVLDPWTQMPSFALYEMRSVLPIQIQNAISFLGGEMDAFDAMTRSIGVQSATSYPDKTK